MKITKSILSKKLASLTGIPNYIAKKQVNEVFFLLAEGVKENEEVMISGLGRFETNTGNIVFSPSKKLKIAERSSKNEIKGCEQKGKTI